MNAALNASLRDLRVFVVLADVAHFTRAAERLEISQSSLSAIVRKLEDALGARLFDRHTRVCRLTEAGIALLPAARRLVGDWEDLLGSARDLAGLVRGRVTVAAPSVQSALLLPPIVQRFAREHPGVKVTVRDVPEQQVHELVRSGEADLGVATETDARTDLLATAFYSDHYLAALPKSHPLAPRKSLEWAHLRREPVVGPLPDNPVRRNLDTRLAKAGLALTYTHEVSLPWTMAGLVREGLGIAVLTTATQPMIDWLGLVARPLTRPSLTRNLVLLRAPARTLSPGATAFRDLVIARAGPGAGTAR